MHFTKLRLSGFKSFVEVTDLGIEPGMTGIVGPNGCGKSNLVEALRWVMGESSAKRMRGGAMDDVIFNGTATRPPRNLAEVTLVIDNSDRKAPAALNDADELVVSRRIERDAGSIYRVNGKEVRARDIHLLFADLASGAHSPALVSQGRIGAVVNARPTDRRALLEEAAGITGLHSRRHEAELRLRGAEQNLERLDDVMTALEGQLQSIKRQARQANRYRRIAEDVRRTEAILLHLRHRQAEEAVEQSAALLRQAEARVAELTRAVAEATTAHEAAAEALPPLRQAETEAAAKLHHLAVTRDGLDAEERRIAEAQARLEGRIAQIDDDERRERAQAADAEAAMARLGREGSELEAASEGQEAADAEAGRRVEQAAAALQEKERALDELTQTTAAESARRDGLNRRIADAEQRIARLSQRHDETERERVRIETELRQDQALQQAESLLQTTTSAAEAARQALDMAERERSAREAVFTEAREALLLVENEAAKLAAEEKALAELLAAGEADLWPPLVDAVTVQPGYEVALGAALGDDLNMPADEAAPVHWATLPADPAAPPLPEGAVPLSSFVKAPSALARRLAQIGVVDAADGARLREALRQGQRLVTRDGGLWRWDGFTITAGAETAAAIRLRQRNRLQELREARAAVEMRSDAARGRFDQAREANEAAGRNLGQARDLQRLADQKLQAVRDSHGKAERAAAARSSRLQALLETSERVAGELAETRAERDAAVAELEALPPLDAARQQLAGLRAEVAELRAGLSDARAALAALRTQAAQRADRIAAISVEKQAWRGRADAAARQLAELAARREQATGELAEVNRQPAEIARRRSELLTLITAAEAARNRAADALAAAESGLAERQKTLRQAEQALAAERESKVRLEAQLEQAKERRQEIASRIRESLDCGPDQALAAGGVEPDADLPDVEQAAARLDRLRRERDNMGPVNLRAEQEAAELEQQLDTMKAERADLEAAIARLRQGIASLNREGRERLLAAFKQVDQHFRDLFVRLFGGGNAHLALTESDDPLEAGLEIMASPPGKRLQSLSLLSGGEQALTAMALLFAAFLTNPAPICVLDEVDAPLDDANVERFCNLVQEISHAAGTRFLIITHHAFSMARMDRLFGVTMAERGVSQLVSVDLTRAERIRATA